jgi:hypothetical protein
VARSTRMLGEGVITHIVGPVFGPAAMLAGAGPRGKSAGGFLGKALLRFPVPNAPAIVWVGRSRVTEPRTQQGLKHFSTLHVATSALFESVGRWQTSNSRLLRVVHLGLPQSALETPVARTATNLAGCGHLFARPEAVFKRSITPWSWSIVSTVLKIRGVVLCWSSPGFHQRNPRDLVPDWPSDVVCIRST